ncbi:YqhG family protein [Schinkia sp. CFF1]
MQQEDIHNFLVRFFLSNGCEIMESSAGHLVVQLTVDLDKLLMNRPFYWHYLEKTGGKPNPFVLTLITDYKKAPAGCNGETIHFGSPRLHQIFKVTKALASHIRLFEQVNHGQKTALQPWLVLNTKVSYICDQKKELFISLGLNLINGVVLDQIQRKLSKKTLTPKIPDYCFTLSPLIKPQSGLKRIENIIIQMINSDDHEWAEKAEIRWEKDLQLLDHFYEDVEEKPESYLIEKNALEEQYKPRIKVDIVSGGLFYLTQQIV